MIRTLLLMMLMLCVPLMGCPDPEPDFCFGCGEPGDDDDDDDDTPDPPVWGDCFELDPTGDEDFVYFEGDGGEQVGWAVTGMEDLSGDGFGEIAFSARQHDGETNSGRVYVFFSQSLQSGGRLDLDDADVILEGPDEQAFFGQSLAAIDDVDRVSGQELLVGATSIWSAFLFTSEQLLDDDEWEADDAHAYIWTDNANEILNFGNPEIGMDVATLAAPEAGTAAAIAIGAPAWPLSNTGRVAVFAAETLEDGGDLDFMSDADVVIDGHETFMSIGEAVTGVGDIDGDGYEELAVGSYRTSAIESDSFLGRVFVFSGDDMLSGGDALTTDADFIFNGSADGGQFGQQVAGLGDLDGDERSDLAIASPREATASANDGAVRIWLSGSIGAEQEADEADVQLRGSGGEYLGEGLAGEGDFNGDGSPDLMIAGPARTTTGSQFAGKVYLTRSTDLLDVVGEEDDVVNSTQIDHAICGMNTNELIGRSSLSRTSRALAIVPDVDGDGVDDLLIGAPSYSPDKESLAAGRVYLVLSRWDAPEVEDDEGGE